MACVKWCDFAGTIRAEKLPGSNLNTWEIILATFSNWMTNNLLKTFSGETPEVPSQLYVAINSTQCSRASQGTELSGDGYARSAISFERVSDIQRWNPADVYSPTASAEWPQVYSFSLHDAPTGGNYVAYGNLVAPISVASGKAILWEAEKVAIGIGSAV
jgi:hypothetical protein